MLFPDIFIIGSGNLAGHLADVLTAHKLPLKGIMARNIRKGKKLAGNCGVSFISPDETVLSSGALIFCCISDDAIAVFVKRFRKHDVIFVHCSGMQPIPEIQPHDRCRFGVFYPVYSFSQQLPVNWEGIPVCAEAHDRHTLTMLQQLAGQISGKYYRIDSSARAVVHLAAVFANNFTNLAYRCGKELLKTNGLTFELIRPIIRQTAEKAMHSDPYTLQTGPARRGDRQTIRAHRQLLREQPDILKVYNALTSLISHTYNASPAVQKENKQARRARKTE